MAITSVGYGGTIDETAWTGLAPFLGRQYSVDGEGDFTPSIVSAAVRTVKVTAGTAVGYGVSDTSDGDVQKVFDEATSGSRFDLLVLRRNWDGAGGLTTVEVVKGTSSRNAVFALRNMTPGDVDDQPIALVKITAGQSLPTEVSDVRLWSTGGGSFALSEDVMQYADAPGTTIRIGGAEWVRTVSATSGAAAWVKYPAAPYAESAGSVACAVTGGTAFSRAITFPVGRFSQPPVVFVNIASSAGPTGTWHVRAIASTTTGFTIFGFGPASTFTTTVTWHALQMTSAATAG